ncbi:hypothetical protein SAMN05443287_10420 [Micromonospora phaseoli]|uniref:Uncharacterized protein n=1 Tax=Micromonospora phaseoli TaxID=1144548 RepID=A0A1H6YDX0_9ACTN|nr:hypothetical protein [Micromonospora phaseoli]PZV99992.1 hypothetical protein CLV64_10319 [Micromonospora phaseoli]GIJ81188.1 hypothetical protein Xph01_56200 [Micromonospora phaseoli]SEJ35382.1 hypothetical protein SAMN05443287_10420 [Micromonospora phaseoli]
MPLDTLIIIVTAAGGAIGPTGAPPDRAAGRWLRAMSAVAGGRRAATSGDARWSVTDTLPLVAPPVNACARACAGGLVRQSRTRR